MLTKTPVPKSLKGEKIKSSALVKNSIESKVENEKKLIDTINTSFNKKREDILKTLDINGAKAYLEEEKRSFNSFIDQFGQNADRLDTVKAALKKEINKHTLKKFPEFKEIIKLNAQHMNHLHNALHSDNILSDIDRGLVPDLEVVIFDDDYVVLYPPYELQEADLNVGGDFDQDDSFPWADWGTLTNYVRYSHEHSWTEMSTHSHKYAHSSVGLGVNYKMPKHGSLDITVVLKNLDNQVAYAFTDNTGPSYAKFVIENTFFIPVSSGGTQLYLHSATMFDESKRTEGGNTPSQSIFPVTTDAPFIINFRTDHIHEGEDLRIMIASWLRVYSTSFRMRIDMIASLLWKVEKIYLKVVE